MGGGSESLKRITPLLEENCKITVFSEKTSKPINKLALKKKIQIKKQRLEDANFLSVEKPYIVLTTTDDKNLNKEIIKKAKKLKIIVYSADNPDESDFANPALINFKKIIDVAIFTRGKSPLMSKKLKETIEKTLQKSISSEDIEQIKIQQMARSLIKDKISNQIHRREFLKNLTNDKKIKQLIKDGQREKVEKHIITMLRDWK